MHFQIHPDIAIPGYGFRMCLAFWQDRSKCKSTKPVSAQHTKLFGDVEVTHDMMPYNYGSLSFVGDYVLRDPRTGYPSYRIYVDLLKIDMVESQRSLIDLDITQFTNYEKLGVELTLRVSPEIEEIFRLLQDGQTLVFVNSAEGIQNCIEGKIVGLRQYENEYYVMLSMDSREDAEKIEAIFVNGDFNDNDILLATDRDMTRESIIGTYFQMRMVHREFPAKLYGPISRYRSASIVGSIPIVPIVMEGATVVVVQPNFHDAEWKATDEVWAILHKKEDVLELPETVQRYTIEFYHEHDIPSDAHAAVFVGHYMRESLHDFYRCVVINIAPMASRFIGVLNP